MKNLLRTLVSAIIIIGIALAVWKGTGGDPSDFFTGILSVIYAIITAVSDFFGMLLNAFFGK